VNTRTVTWFFCLASSLILSGCALTFSSCRAGSNSQENSNAQTLPVATTPPFATKEPARYRAVRTITSFESGSDKPRVTTTVIARDGSRRREEYDSTNGEKIVYLTTPGGAFILVPSERILAAVDAMGQIQPGLPQALDDEPSADRLLNQVSVETRYQKLGPETLNGRSATKYRVLTTSQTKGTDGTSETLIWVDDALEMPIKWETKGGSDPSQIQVRMELSEISLAADAMAFELPKDYRKVDMAALLSLITGHRQPETPKTVRN
jgi:hypothetical protein